MHVGFDWVFSTFAGGATTPPENPKAKRLSGLSKEDKYIYDKIVRDLKDAIANDKPSVDQTKTLRTFSIIFRETESWQTVEQLFTELISANGISSKQHEWGEKWLQRIADLRGLHNRVRSTGHLILHSKDNSNISNLRATLSDSMRKIKVWVNTSFQDLESESSDSNLTKNHLCSNIINFINENWLLLTVFSDWPSVHMDAKKLFVQVSKDGCVKLSDPPVSLSRRDPIKAHFTVQEILVTVPDQDAGTLNYLAVNSHHIAKSPAPKKRESSSVRLTSEYFLNYSFVHDPAHYKGDGKRISLGDSLHRIVNWAVEDVNQDLTGLPASSTKQVDGWRLDLSILLPRLWSKDQNTNKIVHT